MKSIIKSILSRIAYHLGFWRFLHKVSSIVVDKKYLIVFTYHRITDGKQTSSHLLGYDCGLDKEDFKTQIEGIAKCFDVIDLDKYIDVITGRAKLKKHSALITFDDADAEFMDHAWPVLKRIGCPSVVFTPTAYIDTDLRFWHLRVSNSIRKMTPEMWAKLSNDTIDVPEKLKSLIQSDMPSGDSRKAEFCQYIVDELDNYNHPVIDDIIDRFEKVTGKEYDLGIQCLSWENHRVLAEQGVRFESHGVLHVKLEELKLAEIEKEFKDSKREIEKQLNTNVKSICYPAGSYNDSVVELAPKAGYEVGFTTQTGVSDYPLSGLDLFKVPRLVIYGDDKYKVNLNIGKILLKLLWRGRI